METNSASSSQPASLSFSLLSPFLEGLVGARNWLYDQKIITSTQLSIPVISVGNITMGGTGKTPFIQWLLKELLDLGFHPGVVSRNYGAREAQEGLVTFSSHAAQHFGDEPVLLKMNFPHVPIYAGAKKWRSAKQLCELDKSIDVLLVDDGFQHRRLARDMDIVLLDTSVHKSDYAWPPLGRAREPFSAVKRAQVIVFTKWEQRNPETVDYLEKCIDIYGCSNKINNSCERDNLIQSTRSTDPETTMNSFDSSNHSDEFGGVKFKKTLKLYSEQKLGALKCVRGGALVTINETQKGFAFCGLARPENFLLSLKTLGLCIGEFKPFPDHFGYGSNSMRTIIELAKNYDYAVTSEKDWVKLSDWPEKGPALYILPVSQNLLGDCGGFREMLSRLRR